MTSADLTARGFVRLPYLFSCDCDGMIAAVRRAANPQTWNGWNPSTCMTAVQEAVWWSKEVMRKARALGLYQDCQDPAQAQKRKAS